MTTDMHARLHDALNARVAGLEPSADSVDTIARMLALDVRAGDSADIVELSVHPADTRAARRGTRRWAPRVSAAVVAAAVVVAMAALVTVFRGSDGSTAAADLPGYPLPSADYVIGLRAAATDNGGQDVVVRVSTGEVVGTLPADGDNALADPVLSPNGLHLYGLRTTSRGQSLIDLNPVTGTERSFGVAPTGTSTESALVISPDGLVLGSFFHNQLVGGRIEAVDLEATNGRRESGVDLPDTDGRAPTKYDAPIAVGPKGSALVLGTARPSSVLTLLTPRGLTRALGNTGARCASNAPQSLIDPSWTRQGLYALRGCGRGGHELVEVVQLNPSTGALTVLHRLPYASLAGVHLAALDGPRFVIGDNDDATRSQPGADVTVYDATDGWHTSQIFGLERFPR